jgi:molecular chaperone GrpE
MTDRKHTRHDEKRGPRATAGGSAQAGPDEVVGARPVEGEEPEPATVAAGAAPTPVGAPADDLATVAAERDEYLDHLRRLKAEFENYRKRVQRDHEELRLRAAETVVESLLPVMDNMSRALEAGDSHGEGQLAAGLQLVVDQMRGTLEGHGLEEIPVEPGVLFDPNLHEAIMMQASPEYTEGSVLQVLERGYLLHGRLLRPAKVIVVS